MNKIYINAGAIVLHYFQNTDKNFMPIEKFTDALHTIKVGDSNYMRLNCFNNLTLEPNCTT